MKKGLSILLVAAALFGFYGGATNLNDVLACKDYWEKAGEESTANMNKLEDGLNQLKENEQAYLDGKQQVADGEVALADAEQQLADGEAQLADGRAELAKGEADYAAAPGKLADARKQIAKGEKDLAEGEQTLADGYDAYNEGEATLKAGKAAVADGEKKLAAAKKQLEQGEKDLAAGKQQVAAGEESIAGLTQLIDGIDTILKGYNDGWKPGYESLKDGRSKLYNGSKGSKDDLAALAAFLPEASRAAYVGAVNDVAGDDEEQTADDYKDFIKSTNAIADALPKIQEAVATYDAQANAVLAGMKAPETPYDFAKFVKENKTGMLALAALISDETQKEEYVGGINTVAQAYDNFEPTVDAQYAAYIASDEGKTVEAAQIDANMDKGWEAFFATDNGKQAIAGTKQLMAKAGLAAKGLTNPTDEQIAQAASTISDEDAKTTFRNSGSDSAKQAEAGIKAQVKSQVDDAIKENVKAKVLAAYNAEDGDLAKGRTALTTAVATIAATLDAVNEKVNADDSAIKSTLQPGLKQFNDATKPDEETNVSPVDTLTGAQNQLAGGVSTIASAVLGNETLKAGVKENLGDDAIKLLTAYQNSTNPLSSSMSDFAKFGYQMDTNPALVTNLTKAKALLAQTKAAGEKALEAGKNAVAEGEAKLAAGYKEYEKGQKDLAAGKKAVAEGEPALAAAAKKLAQGEKDLAAGRKKLAAGKAQYAQGLKDYEEAPAKLAAGRQKLAEGEATLADGYKQYEEGKQTLADGKAQLAQYEDGEQQVRDGLATLTGTEADLDLQSIADRLNGDVDFDNGDDHLDIDEGLAAVEVGRGYQAEDGDLITKEITARAVGTAGLLGAGVLAVLAAILSFIKKNKGAGVAAILAACAGAFGAFYGTNAGTYFSQIAGSTAGNAGWVAAGILGVVALVHAIAHFTAKKEA